MAQYHDFEYVKYILNLPYNEGLELYNLCIGRFNDNQLWDIFLVEVMRGAFEGSFEDYKKMTETKIITNNMTYEEKEQEEKRIIEKVLRRVKDERFN